MMELIDALNWRYATKRMNGQKVSNEKLEKILEAIRLAPTSLGLQAFRVFVVETPALRAEIHEKACPQPQIIEGSHVLVFAAYNSIEADFVEEYINRIAAERNVPVEQLEQFKGMIDGFVATHSKEQQAEWTSRQTYIALGMGLAAAALEKVDATPMEGFNPAELDKILGLSEKNLHSVNILTLGYRDANTDYLANAKKVRLSNDELFVTL